MNEGVIDFKEYMNSRQKKTIQELIEAKPDCYVLITCKKSDEQGKRQVDMIYDGNMILASVLLEGALVQMEREIDDAQSALSGEEWNNFLID